MKRKRLILTTVLLVCVAAVVASNWDRLHFLIVARPADWEVNPKPAVRVDGYYHRWKTYVDGRPIPVGTWFCYFGRSNVIHFKTEYYLDGFEMRRTIWLPNGKLSEQIDYDMQGPHADRRVPPWKWGETDQSIGTKQLRGCILGWTTLDGLDLRDADLRDTDLHDSTFHGTDVRDAILEGADLCGADFSRAENLTIEQVLTAKKWNMDKATDRGFNMPETNVTRFSSDIEQELTRRGLRSKGAH